MKHTLGVFAVAAALAVSGGVASMPAAAASSNNGASAANGLESNHAVTDTDMSSHRRHWRRYHYVRPYVYPYSYGYYRPRPYYYRPYSYAYSPYYYRPYYRPAPVFSIGFGFGPRYHW